MDIGREVEQEVQQPKYVAVGWARTVPEVGEAVRSVFEHCGTRVPLRSFSTRIRLQLGYDPVLPLVSEQSRKEYEAASGFGVAIYRLENGYVVKN